MASHSQADGRSGAHTILRQETRAAHDSVETAFARFDLSRREDYGRFLVAQARAFLPAEAAVAPEHLRGDALRADLAELGLPCPPPIELTEMATPAHRLGAWYVLEGSRLGGAVLARQVGPGFPCAFLTAQGPRWAKFVELLENTLYQPRDIANAVAGARATFALFERAASEFGQQHGYHYGSARSHQL